MIGILNSIEEPSLLENLCGKTVLSISQDFHVEIFQKIGNRTPLLFQRTGGGRTSHQKSAEAGFGLNSTSLSKQEIATQILDFCQTLFFLRLRRGLSL